MASDLRKLKEMEQKLIQNNFNFELPTLVLSEVVLAYLSTKYSSAVIQWVSKSIPNSIFVEFEQFQTDTTFSSVMTDHFIRLGSPLKTIFDLPNISDRRNRLEKAGFDTIELFPMMDIELVMRDLEPFDEYEALHAVLKHYYLGMSCNTEQNHGFIAEIIDKLNIRKREYPLVDFKWKFANKNGESTRRSFHSTTSNGNEVLIFGGFGSDTDENAHKKLTSMVKIPIDQNQSAVLDVINDVTFEAVSPVTLCFTNGTTLVYGGRKSPYKVNLEYKQLNSDMKVHVNLPENLIGSYRTAVCSIGPDHFVQFGGRGNPKGSFSSSLYEIKLVGNEIIGTELTPNDNDCSLPPLASSTVTFLNGKIWIIGGLFENGSISNKIFKVENESSGYRIVETATMKFAIYGHTATVYNNQIVICGGISDISYDDDYIIMLTDDNECSIERIRFDGERCLMHGHGMIKRDDKIEIIGGGNNCFSFGTHLNYLQTLIERIQS